MTKILKWKLSEKPSSDNILKLVVGGILTKEEAKIILLDEGEYNHNDIEGFQTELALLRKMVLDLSEKTFQYPSIIKIIEREVPNYRNQYWTNPYTSWSNSASLNCNGTSPQNLTSLPITGSIISTIGNTKN